MHTPIRTGFWDIVARDHQDTASVVGDVELLPKLDRSAVYELWSLRVSMTEEGTGDLSSMGVGDGPVGVGTGNDDATILDMRAAATPIVRPNVFWHWGRSNQLQGPLGDVMFPPQFYWAGPLHGLFQNGAGASITYLWTVIYRIVHFRDQDFAELIAKVLPGGADKKRSTT